MKDKIHIFNAYKIIAKNNFTKCLKFYSRRICYLANKSKFDKVSQSAPGLNLGNYD